MDIKELVRYGRGERLFGILLGRWDTYDCPKCKGNRIEGYVCSYCGSRDRTYNECLYGVYDVEVKDKCHITISDGCIISTYYSVEIINNDGTCSNHVTVISESELFKTKEDAESFARGLNELEGKKDEKR